MQSIASFLFTKAFRFAVSCATSDLPYLVTHIWKETQKATAATEPFMWCLAINFSAFPYFRTLQKNRELGNLWKFWSFSIVFSHPEPIPSPSYQSDAMTTKNRCLIQVMPGKSRRIANCRLRRLPHRA